MTASARPTSARVLVVAIAWLAAVAGAVALVVAVSRFQYLDEFDFSLVYAGLAVAVITDATVGALLTLKRPGNVVGALMMLSAVLLPITFLGFGVGGVLAIERGTGDDAAGLAGLIGSLGIYPTLIIAGPLIALVYPDGRLPGPRWRWPVAAVVAMLAVGSATVLLRPGLVNEELAENPFGMAGASGSEPIWEFGLALAAATMPVALLLALGSVIVRVRRAEAVELAQLKWFVAAVIAFLVFMFLAAIDGSAGPSAFDVLAPWSLSLPPLAVGVAILRYRLYEIDRLISRTVSWGVVTGVLVAVFAGAVVALQAVFGAVTQGETLAVAASTLVVFALLQPVRRKVQTAVDRRFDRRRYDAQQTVNAFAEQVRNEVDLARLRGALVATAHDAVRPVEATVWLRRRSEAAR
jgi:hypothetical protein